VPEKLSLASILRLQRGKERTTEEKKKMWDSIQEIRMDQFRRMYSDAGNDESRKSIMEVSQLEMGGGKCQKCGQAWNRVEFENRYLAGYYFQPACDCFVSCPDCGRWLYDEEAAGILRVDWICTNCGWKLIVDGEKRYGLDYAIGKFRRDKVRELFAKKKSAAKTESKAKVKVG
jgi:hypothetical protein